jgi:hypothetical protein
MDLNAARNGLRVIMMCGAENAVLLRPVPEYFDGFRSARTI